MINETVRTFDSTLGFMEQSVAGLSEQQMVERPTGVLNHAAWTFGHIIVSCQGMASEVGAAQWLPDGAIALPASTLSLPNPSQQHTYFPPLLASRDAACTAALST